ncbi:Hypothetical protein CINCED_3A021427 [Cinara cedri]|uniref:Uncharacterized protein n=1 Tax=Cinara cedri TaxID=506608 RepID=A0A5E4LZD1_9HEMI|nr:Hypothetical protein CINCED_3A021427 [Cinara cedri]
MNRVPRLHGVLAGDGKKNSVPEAGGKSTGKQLSAAIPSPSTSQTPVTAHQYPRPQPSPQRNLTKNMTTTSIVMTGTATAVEVSNVTQSSVLDDAHLQRTLLKPKFLTENSSTVVAQTGASSQISCLVSNLGECVVS